MFKMLGYCGLNCRDCEIYKAANDPLFAKKLAAEWRKKRPKARQEWFRCQGCKGEASLCWNKNCSIAACARRKGIEHCGQCVNFKCSLIRKFENDSYEHHARAVKKLESLKATF